MKDPVNQPGAGYGEASPSVGLTERLLRRHNEPIGLVDVNHADSFYDRTAGWVARRFELLDHWKTRYDTEDTAGAGNGKFVFAAPPVQTSSLVSSEAPLAQRIRQTASSAPSPSLPEQYRVRRQKVSPTSAPVATDTTRLHDSPESRSGDATGTGNKPVGVTGNDNKTTTRGLAERNDSRVVETPTIRGETLQPMPRLIARNNISRSHDYAKGLSAKEVTAGTSQASGVEASSSVSPNDTPPAIVATAPVALAQSPLPKSDLSKASAPRALSLVADRTNDSSREIKSSEGRPTRVEEIATPPAKAESPAVLPLRNSDSSPLRVQRQPAPGSEPLGQQTHSSPLRVQQQTASSSELLARQTDPSAVHFHPEPAPVSEGLVQQTDPSAVHFHPEPAPVSEGLVQQTDPSSLTIPRRPGPGSERLRRQTDSSAPLPVTERFGRQTDSLPLRVQPKLLSGGEELRPQTDSLALSDQQPPVADQVSNTGAAEMPDYPGAQQRLVTSEVPVASASGPRPTMVLRKAAEGSPQGDGSSIGSSANANVTLPLAVNRSAQPGDRVVARQTEAGTPAGSSQVGPAPRDESGPTSSGAAQGSSIDLDQLAEQVGRMLSRQLAVERERRGSKGWH